MYHSNAARCEVSDRDHGLEIADFTMRRLEAAADATLYREVRLEALRTAPESFGSAFASESERPLDWFAGTLETSDVVGGFLAEKLAGVAGLYTHRGVKQAHKAQLWGMFVRPDVRGMGVGRRLAEAIIERARGRAEILQLAVARSNQPARRLYTDLGFKEYGLEKDALKIGDRYFDEILMALDLRPD